MQRYSKKFKKAPQQIIKFENKIEEIKKGKYEENGKKFKTIKFSSDIQHFSGLFLGFGFKFGISQLANNDEKGSKCGCENSKKRKDHLLCN